MLLETLKRFSAPTPAFFQKVQGIGAGLLGLGVTMTALTGAPVIVHSIGGHLCWIGPIIAAVAQLACIAPPATSEQPKA